MQELAFEHVPSTVDTHVCSVCNELHIIFKKASLYIYIYMLLTFEDRLDVIGIEMRVLKRTTGNVT